MKNNILMREDVGHESTSEVRVPLQVSLLSRPVKPLARLAKQEAAWAGLRRRPRVSQKNFIL